MTVHIKNLKRSLIIALLLSLSAWSSVECQQVAQELKITMPPHVGREYVRTRLETQRYIAQLEKIELPPEMIRELAGNSAQARNSFRGNLAHIYDAFAYPSQMPLEQNIFAHILFNSQHPRTQKPATERVLSLGVGSGFDIEASYKLLGPNTQYVGVDFSENLLGYAKERIKKLGLSRRVDLQFGDLLDTPNEEMVFRSVKSDGHRNFDFIYSIGVMGQYFSHEETVRIINNWVKPYLAPQGLFAFVISSEDNHAFPNITFLPGNMTTHPWIRVFENTGINFVGYRELRGSHTRKFLMLFKRNSFGDSQGLKPGWGSKYRQEGARNE